MPPWLPKNATVPAWQITLAHNSLRHARGRQSEPAALSAAWPIWPPHSPQMTFQTGEKVLSQEHGPSGIFSYRRRAPVAVPPGKCAEQESAASRSEEINIQFSSQRAGVRTARSRHFDIATRMRRCARSLANTPTRWPSSRATTIEKAHLPP